MIDKSQLKAIDINLSNLEFDFYYGGQKVGQVWSAKSDLPDNQLAVELTITSHEKNENYPFFYTCLIKCALGRIPLRLDWLPDFVDVKVTSGAQTAEVEPDILRRFGFQKVQKGNSMDFRLALNPTHLEKLKKLKTWLNEARSTSKVVGRGFLVNGSELDPVATQLLMDEYNDLAWGSTSWAKNAALHEDEKKIIKEYSDSRFSVVEVGAGSGRVTTCLAASNGHVTATDYVGQIVATLEKTLKSQNINNVTCVLDDILKSSLEHGKYDRVFLLENGLGAFPSEAARNRVLSSMARLIHPKGLLVLGLRTFDEQGWDSDSDHVMPASQDETTFFGIYHVFAKKAFGRCLPTNLKLTQIKDGDSRQAGGKQFFAILERTE